MNGRCKIACPFFILPLCIRIAGFGMIFDKR